MFHFFTFLVYNCLNPRILSGINAIVFCTLRLDQLYCIAVF